LGKKRHELIYIPNALQRLQCLLCRANREDFKNENLRTSQSWCKNIRCSVPVGVPLRSVNLGKIWLVVSSIAIMRNIWYAQHLVCATSGILTSRSQWYPEKYHKPLIIEYHIDWIITMILIGMIRKFLTNVSFTNDIFLKYYISNYKKID